MQNTIFDLPQTTGSIHFFLGEGSANILETATGELEGNMALGHHLGFRHGPGETGTTPAKTLFYVVVSQGNSGNKVGKW